MPEFRHSTEMAPESRGEGWEVSTLADSRHVAGMPMAARRWRLQPGASAPEQEHRGGDERFLYVISGEGIARVGEARFELAREDVLWLEAGESFALEARAEPLEVLEAVSG